MYEWPFESLSGPLGCSNYLVCVVGSLFQLDSWLMKVGET